MTTTLEKTTDYWHAVERTFGMHTTRAQWDGYINSQRANLERYIRPTGNLVTTYPCPNEFGCRLHHEIHVWREVEYLAVPLYDDYGRCRTYTLTRDEVVEYEIDTPALLSEAFRLLGLRPGALEPMAFYKTYKVGSFPLSSGKRLQAYLVFPDKFEHFREAVTGLLATVDAPFLFMSLTQHYVDPVGAEGLQRHGCAYVSMDEVVQCNELGELELVQGLRDVISLRLPSESGAQSSKTEENVFRKQGDTWMLSYEGQTVYLQDSKGAACIACLLRSPDVELHVAQVLADVAGHADTPVLGSAGEVLTPDAIAKYKEAILDLRTRIRDAEQNNDLGTKAKCEEELDVLTRQLAGAFGLSNRTRQASDDADRIRKTIRGNIKRCLDKLKEAHPPLWHHLSQSLKTGYFLAYKPFPSVYWSL